MNCLVTGCAGFIGSGISLMGHAMRLGFFPAGDIDVR
jgi:nucleoside-diphosphate-sugar epimerase